MKYPTKGDSESWNDYLNRCQRYEEEAENRADYEVEERLIEKYFK